MSQKKTPPNRLLEESSPYLQQHAYNPVQWYPWGEEALVRAREEDKPILVSIGYSTCHWCHVMERESFEDPETAAYMNAHFINIKIDREERPDLDAIYIEAVQLLQQGQGGWPLNCFLLPDTRPFYGGTYFPPEPAYRRPSWKQVLQNLHSAYQDRREDVIQQAAQITAHLQKAQTLPAEQRAKSLNEPLDAPLLKTVFDRLAQNFDREEGGFGGAPKFPGTMALLYCWRYHLATGDALALEQVQLSLKKMCHGGIYDHLRGGFARYTVDVHWLVPHFEKMLYDNALLVSLLAEVYKGDPSPLYAQRIRETLDWVAAEMTAPNGGFYSALDADSEGVEGKFYIWDREEVQAILGENAELFNTFYGVEAGGNWEGQNILHQQRSVEAFAEEKGMDAQELQAFLQDSRALLLEQREQRIRPGLDDKQLLDWNAMLITAYVHAYQALGEVTYLQQAEKAMDFVLQHYRHPAHEQALYHSYKEGTAKHRAFLDDYALLVQALLALYESTQDQHYLQLAKAYTKYIQEQFWDAQQYLYYFTAATQTDVLLHRKAIFDGATPSGNSVMIHNNHQLYALTGDAVYQERAHQAMKTLYQNVREYPSSFGYAACGLLLEAHPVQTVGLFGTQRQQALVALQRLPLLNVYFGTQEWSQAAVAMDAPLQIVICQEQTCGVPLASIEAAQKALKPIGG